MVDWLEVQDRRVEDRSVWLDKSSTFANGWKTVTFGIIVPIVLRVFGRVRVVSATVSGIPEYMNAITEKN